MYIFNRPIKIIALALAVLLCANEIAYAAGYDFLRPASHADTVHETDARVQPRGVNARMEALFEWLMRGTDTLFGVAAPRIPQANLRLVGDDETEAPLEEGVVARISPAYDEEEGEEPYDDDGEQDYEGQPYEEDSFFSSLEAHATYAAIAGGLVATFAAQYLFIPCAIGVAVVYGIARLVYSARVNGRPQWLQKVLGAAGLFNAVEKDTLSHEEYAYRESKRAKRLLWFGAFVVAVALTQSFFAAAIAGAVVYGVFSLGRMVWYAIRGGIGMVARGIGTLVEKIRGSPGQRVISLDAMRDAKIRAAQAEMAWRLVVALIVLVFFGAVAGRTIDYYLVPPQGDVAVLCIDTGSQDFQSFERARPTIKKAIEKPNDHIHEILPPDPIFFLPSELMITPQDIFADITANGSPYSLVLFSAEEMLERAQTDETLRGVINRALRTRAQFLEDAYQTSVSRHQNPYGSIMSNPLALDNFWYNYFDLIVIKSNVTVRLSQPRGEHDFSYFKRWFDYHRSRSAYQRALDALRAGDVAGYEAYVEESFTLRNRSEAAIDEVVINNTKRLLRDQQRHRVVVVRDDSRKASIERLAREHAGVPVETTEIAEPQDLQSPLDELYARAAAHPDIGAESSIAQAHFFRHMLYQGMLQHLYDTATQEGMMRDVGCLNSLRRTATIMTHGFSASDMQEFMRMAQRHPEHTIYENIWDFLNAHGRMQAVDPSAVREFSPGEMNDLLRRPAPAQEQPHRPSPDHMIPPSIHDGNDTQLAEEPSATNGVMVASNIPASA